MKRHIFHDVAEFDEYSFLVLLTKPLWRSNTFISHYALCTSLHVSNFRVKISTSCNPYKWPVHLEIPWFIYCTSVSVNTEWSYRISCDYYFYPQYSWDSSLQACTQPVYVMSNTVGLKSYNTVKYCSISTYNGMLKGNTCIALWAFLCILQFWPNLLSLSCKLDKFLNID